MSGRPRLPLGAFSVLFVVSGCAGGATDPTGPDVAGGGQERVLDFETFRTSVVTVLHERGCSAMGDCHGGGIRGAFELSPAHDRDDVFDFEQSVLQVDDLAPAASPLLRKPLAEAAGGDPHAFVGFDSTDDPGYRAVLDWIEAGELRP